MPYVGDENTEARRDDSLGGQFDRIESVLRSLHERTDVLEKRLDSILAPLPQPEHTPSDGLKGYEAKNSVAVERASSLRVALETLEAKLANLGSRVQL
jgi:hypothetical protein